MPHPSASTISVSRRGPPPRDADCTVVWVRGEQDLATRVSLTLVIARAARLDDVPVLVDLSAVTFMDASTVGAIVGSRNRLASRGQSLELRAPSAPARRILELCGLTDLIHTDPVHATGVSAALQTWVEVPPIEPSKRLDRETAPVVAHGATRPSAERATADLTVDATAQVAGAGRDGR